LKAIFGLGNPGTEYRRTRHNVGFEVIDDLARRWRVDLRSSWKRKARLAAVKNRDVLLVQPQTFMNLSGASVAGIMAFYKLAPADVLIVVDEVQLPLGKLRVRPSGSAGGHNGLKSVIASIGSDFPRLRIGVGRGNEQWDLSDHVLGKFAADELPVVERAVKRAADAVETFITEGVFAAMNQYNAVEKEGLDGQKSEKNLKSEI
jgi:peptidyl-tRNA hydrolase, PTH1 family